MTEINTILSKYRTLSLMQVEKARLFDRMEVKYVFNIEDLPKVLDTLSEYYSLLKIEEPGLRIYENRYFDTPDLKMYIDHHNGKLNRYKLRFRSYADTGNTFFEIKFKNNKGRTLKSRIEVPQERYVIDGNALELLKRETEYLPEMLYESLIVRYKRVTLIKKESTERLTFDLDLHYQYGQSESSYPYLVVAEVKQPRTSSSKFISLMHEMHIQPFSFSKYCLGIASVYPGIKANNFKTKVRYVNKFYR